MYLNKVAPQIVIIYCFYEEKSFPFTNWKLRQLESQLSLLRSRFFKNKLVVDTLKAMLSFFLSKTNR